MTQEDVDAVVTELEDYIQAVIYRVFGINEGEETLTAGTTAISFDDGYDTGEEWKFIKRVAINDDGYDIGFAITNETVNGFSVTVDEACTFKWRTSYMRNWITD